MSTRTRPVSLKILDKDYVIACPASECEDLLQSAQYLTKKMQEVRESGKVVSTERIAVLAALNIVHELLHLRASKNPVAPDISADLQRLESKISQTLLNYQ
jgi:cell division protein ZapA